VRYLRQEPNRGPAAARNRGIEAATGEIIAFTDDDCLVPPNYLARLAEGYQHYPEIAGAGGYLEAPGDLLQRNLFAQYEAHVTHQVYHAGPESYLGGFECPAGGTNSMSYRRECLKAVGGFDETFPYAAGEDADLKWRICECGAKLLYVPVKVTHLQSYTWPRFCQQQIVRGQGVVHFERKRLGKIPSRPRILLRLAKRTFLLFRDLVVGPDRRLAIVYFAARWYDGLGQLQEIAKEKG
jgi:GT2 family glycosyltransferase